LDTIKESWTPHTKAIFTESPGSLTFEIQDIPAIAALAHKKGALVILDNTWASPLFFKPFDKGVDISIQAATKYLCGHADLLLGTITTTQQAYRAVYDTHRRLGLCASGDDIYLTLRGLRTLDVRLERHQKTGIKLAKFLSSQKQVADVIHPALETHPQHKLWQRDFFGASGLFAFRLNPVSEAQLAKMFDNFELFAMGFSWGGFESLIIPATPVRTATKSDNSNPLIRVHAGLEDEDDLIEDLRAGLERL
jgi:cystathionine beta-lyase